MTESQRAALIDLCHAIGRVGHIDQFTRFRARRLLQKLTGHPFTGMDIFV